MTPRSLIGPARLAGAPLLRSQSDERLVDLVRAGYEPAFEAIVARYRRPLLRYCSGFLPEARAEDVVQQAFVKAYGALRDGDGEMQLRPWLYRIAHNTALNALRDRGLEYDELDESIDGVERPDQAFERHERLREVVAAVGSLPERQRDAIVLRELEGRSYEEIAGELGVTGGAVRQLLNRARNSVRAAAAAVTPVGLITRIPWASAPDQPVAERVAETVAGVGGGALVAKLATTAVITGAVVGGVASAPDVGTGDATADRPDRKVTSQERRSSASGGESVKGAEPGGGAVVAPADDRGRGRGKGGADDGDDGDNSGKGGGGEDEAEPDDDDDKSNSGHGGGGSSGSGSGGSGSSGSGGSGSGGSGSSGSGGSGSESEPEEPEGH